MKKYKVIAKIGNDEFAKWNVNNLIKFTKFLDKNYPNWRGFNVYEYRKEGNGQQIANFTTNNRPRTAFVRL